MRILGICHDVLICSAAVVDDGQVVAAIAEERLDRRKQSRVFPTLAIDRCLREAGLTLDDIDEIAVAWNPSIDLETVPGGSLTGRRHRSEHLLQVPARLMQLAGASASSELTIRGAYDAAPPITFVNHYDAHIGNCYHLTDWDDAALAVLDGRAERQTSLLGFARGTEITTLSEVDYPSSLGLFYGAVTQFLGFRPDSDEWKVMALASFGDNENEFTDQLRELVHVHDDGTFNLDLSFFEFYNQFDPRMYSDRFVHEFGKPRTREDALEPRHERMAAAAQVVFEEAMTKILGVLHAQSGIDRLAVSGGCFMNSVFNGKITDVTPFDEVFVSSCPDDSGTSIGAALFLHASRTGARPAQTHAHNYWGPSFTDDECLDTVRRYGITTGEVVDDVGARAAQDLVDGHIVGWFQGAMEFGQRALGNRSILLDPRRADGKDVVNSAVKFRESFRPFAPAILAEHVSEWFECAPDARVPFMEKVFRFRPGKAEMVPAVTHVDGTGRLQTVDTDSPAARYRDLIEAFDRLTGVPIVLNTSFNLNGEPIVCTPDDALRTFATCAIDVLYLGNVRITK